jgi:type I restriction enzyme S subunit
MWDVLVSMIGTVGEPCLIKEEPSFAIKNIGLFKSRSETEGKWLYYYLCSPQAQQLFQELSRGTTQAYIPLGALRDFPVSVPADPSEIHAIVHILGTLDEKIELNRRMNETLDAMARALFKSWFVDFDPVRAKAEGRDTGLPSHLADLFPDSFQDSDQGEIPNGWTIKSIEDITERVGMGPFGSSIKVETFVPEGVPIISGQHLDGFMMEDNDFNFITIDHADRLKSANVGRGDVIFTHAGNIGQVSYIPQNSQYERYVLSQRQFFMRCDLDNVTPSFMALYFKSPEGRHRLLENTSSSGVPSIARPVTYLRSIQLKVPSKQVLDAFDQLIQPMLIQFRSNQNESRTIATLRDTLLPKLIAGEIRVNSK